MARTVIYTLARMPSLRGLEAAKDAGIILDYDALKCAQGCILVLVQEGAPPLTATDCELEATRLAEAVWKVSVVGAELLGRGWVSTLPPGGRFA